MRLPGYARSNLADVQTFVFNNNLAGTVVTASAATAVVTQIDMPF